MKVLILAFILLVNGQSERRGGGGDRGGDRGGSNGGDRGIGGGGFIKPPINTGSIRPTINSGPINRPTINSGTIKPQIKPTINSGPKQSQIKIKTTLKKVVAVGAGVYAGYKVPNKCYIFNESP